MKILHISAECYPAAKVGGLADVVGALPKYQNNAGLDAAVIIPKYYTNWVVARPWESRFDGYAYLDDLTVWFSIQECIGSVEELGFRLFAVHVPGYFDRQGVYADVNTGAYYSDEMARAMVFQQAVLRWVNQFAIKPEILHCHDHQTGLIPFMVKYCPVFGSLANVPTMFTLHNGNYQGVFTANSARYLPAFQVHAYGMLEWGGTINSVACAHKNSWGASRPSENYKRELEIDGSGLEMLYRAESFKIRGILNGIDTDVWNPNTDLALSLRLVGDDVEDFKAGNRDPIYQEYGFDPSYPLITYIGRFAGEKGADLLPDVIARFIQTGGPANFFVLGSGDPVLEATFMAMRTRFPGRFNCSIAYNEALSHRLYAGSDFIVMPSRVEPCGLNQMYAMRYGTTPIVRSVGGLVDTVKDVGEPGGWGIRFNNFTTQDCYDAFVRAVQVYSNQTSMHILRRRQMAIDNSWERSTQLYTDFYRQFGFMS